MSYYTQPFAPDYGKAVTVAVGIASAVQSFPNNASAVEITNLSAVRCSIRFGETNSLTAGLDTDYTILPGQTKTITKQRNYQFFAHIAAAAGGSLNLIPGEGF